MLYFAFCIHNHQPAGNFDRVLKKAYRRAYWPFLKTLSKYPSIKLSLHTSGFLLDWIVENCPEYIELLKLMVGRGQVEIVGGGYYEPVLTVIPDGDGLGQIRRMSDRLEEIFGVRPRGLWLAERVWEPTLPTLLKRAGIEYVLVDDYHFIKAGLTKERLGGYYITEDRGSVIKVLPGNEALRYLIPFRPVKDLEKHLEALEGFFERGNAAIYGDDGEKFGIWPGTHNRVFTKGWLKGFFGRLEKLEWLKPVTLGEYVEVEEPLGRIYLPTTSYMEMGEWSLPPEASKAYAALCSKTKRQSGGELVRRFIQGGTWRNFFAKYPESNWMHKRMLLVSRGLKGAGKVGIAEELLYKAQCNDAYWHGIFGGLYLPHLRAEIYKNIIEAEGLIPARKKVPATALSIEKTDLDADGRDEVIVRTRDLNLFITPEDGGALVEIDYKPGAVNILNTLSRWPEAYHDKLRKRGAGRKAGGSRGGRSIHDRMLAKGAGLDKYLKMDSRRRATLRDHFLPRDAALGAFSANEHEELGDFSGARYEVGVEPNALVLSHSGIVNGGPVSVRKEIRPRGANSFSVDYHVGPGAGKKTGAKCLFGVEFNLILPCSDGPMCSYRFSPASSAPRSLTLGGFGRSSGVNKISLIDKYSNLSVTIEIDTSAALWRFPVHTVSLSETGFEKIYQGSCLLFLLPFDPGVAGGLAFRFVISVERFSQKRGRRLSRSKSIN